MACNVNSTSKEILVEVLMRLMPDSIAKNDGDIPLDEYALKLYGYDEFLRAESVIGKHLFVGHFLSIGKDIELDVGKRRLMLVTENKYMEKLVKILN